MYMPATGSTPSLSQQSSNGHGHANRATTNGTNGHTSLTDEQKRENEELNFAKDVHRLAERFLNKVPACKFSPAQLQGYIMLYKDRPADAVEDVEDWVTGKLEHEMQQSASVGDGGTGEGEGGVLVIAEKDL
jgi:mitochondrial chaperone BCS1